MRQRAHRCCLFPYTTLFRSTGGDEGAHGWLVAQRALDSPRRAQDLERRQPEPAGLVLDLNITDTELGCYAVKPDRKSTRLNSSHSQISYAVLSLKKKKRTSI